MEDRKLDCPWDILQSNVALPAWLGSRVDSSRFVSASLLEDSSWVALVPWSILASVILFLLCSYYFPDGVVKWGLWLLLMDRRSSRGRRSLCLCTWLITDFWWNLPDVCHGRCKSLFLLRWHIYHFSDVSWAREILSLIKQPPMCSHHRR